MSYRNSLFSYGSVAKFFHWLIALLIIAMLIYGYFLENIPKAYAGFAYNLHKMTGITIFALVVLRMLWGAINPKPMIPPGTPMWQRLSEYLVHYTLYLCILAMPLAGWIGSSAAGKAPHLGGINFMLPIAQSKTISSASFFIHNNLAIIIIVLVSVHVLAALYHHFIKRDNILRRMLPYGG
ncbi:MAG: cytochrome b [Gammaproteobacteria bacterium]|nr:cytochrome b [Gammaproteobacteria bacterium]